LRAGERAVLAEEELTTCWAEWRERKANGRSRCSSAMVPSEQATSTQRCSRSDAAALGKTGAGIKADTNGMSAAGPASAVLGPWAPEEPWLAARPYGLDPLDPW
jgi:hypothetical protein